MPSSIHIEEPLKVSHMLCILCFSTVYLKCWSEVALGISAQIIVSMNFVLSSFVSDSKEMKKWQGVCEEGLVL